MSVGSRPVIDRHTKLNERGCGTTERDLAIGVSEPAAGATKGGLVDGLHIVLIPIRHYDPPNPPQTRGMTVTEVPATIASMSSRSPVMTTALP